MIFSELFDYISYMSLVYYVISGFFSLLNKWIILVLLENCKIEWFILLKIESHLLSRNSCAFAFLTLIVNFVG